MSFPFGLDALPLINRGKVRRSFALPGHDELRLVVASDHISIYDFVLGFTIPRKGEVLTAMNIFWRKKIREHFKGEILDDLVGYGAGIDAYLPEDMRGQAGLQSIGIVASNLEMILVEAIVRAYITGSGYTAYRDTGVVCGNEILVSGLADGARLPRPLYTPTTKAQGGEHDEHLTVAKANRMFGPEVGELSLEIFRLLSNHCTERGIIIPDTKLEFGRLPLLTKEVVTRDLILADEVGTPDSSRFWDAKAYAAAFPNSLPPAFDKEFVREWGKGHGVNKLDSTSETDRDFVRELVPPPGLIEETTARYLEALRRVADRPLEEFQRDEMGIAV